MNIKAKLTPQKNIQVTRVAQTQSQTISIYNIEEMNLDDLSDGDVLVWDETNEYFNAQKLLDKQELNGGEY